MGENGKKKTMAKSYGHCFGGTYHLLDVVGGTERIVLVAGVDVVHFAGVLVATEVGDRREGGGSRRGGDEGIGGSDHGRRRGRTLDGEAGTVGFAVTVGIGTRLGPGLKLLAGVALGHGPGLAFLKGGAGASLAGIGVGLVGSIAVERVAEGAALTSGGILILMVIHGGRRGDKRLLLVIIAMETDVLGVFRFD